MSESLEKSELNSNMIKTDNQSLSDVKKVKKSKKSKKPRCCAEGCRKKLGLIPFNCKCGLSFCSLHRMASDHNCTFDWQEDGKLKLHKELMSGKSNDNHGLVSY